MLITNNYKFKQRKGYAVEEPLKILTTEEKDMAYECRRTTGRREKQTGEADMQKWGRLK